MNSDEFRKRCRGIVPVQYCPYKDNFELDVEGLRENTKFIVEFAKRGQRDVMIMTNGSTTEFYANSLEEQKTVIKTVVDTVGGRIPVVAGAAQAGTIETIKMAKYAEKAGADCAMIVLPYYHRPTKEGLYRHYEAIANSVKIAVMIYSNPDVSGTLIDVDLLKRLSKIENIVALKDNNPNVAEYAWKSTQIDPDDMTLLNGYGEIHYLGSMAYGLRYKGFATWIANFAPSLSYDVYEAARSGDFRKAMDALKKTMPLWGILDKFQRNRQTLSIIPSFLNTPYMYMSVGKACMSLTGLHGGPLRLPMEDLTEKEKGELKALLKELEIT